ncbi:hypothetical protein EV360DRAFT_76929 [Lentinula raphanica]|nr:hypothetical protein EV360DRAFT_76929 [Lentinula raphanica]
MDEPVAQTKRPPRVHIEEVIDEDYDVDQDRPSAPSLKFTHSQASNTTPSIIAPSASPSNTSHAQASSASRSRHKRPPHVHVEKVIDEYNSVDQSQSRPSAPSSNPTHAQAADATPINHPPGYSPSASPSNTSHAQASSATPSSHQRLPRVHIEEVIDKEYGVDQSRPSAPSSNPTHAQAPNATPINHPPGASPSNTLHTQASRATPSSHPPSAPPSNTSHAQAPNATASSYPSKRKTMSLYVDVEDDDPIITSDLTDLDDSLDGRPLDAGPSHSNDDADEIIREEIKRLISTEVRTRHMMSDDPLKQQTKFLRLLDGPNPDLTKIMCMILLHLRPVRSLDPTGVILGGALSEKADDQGPDIKASLLKRKQYRKTKHRPTSRVTLQASVRAETKELLNSTLVDGNLVSVDPRIIKKWERGTHRGPTVESFHLQLEGNKESTKKGAATWTPWNKRATEVFVTYFCSLDGFQNCKPDIVARTFCAHLLNLREKYLAQNSDPLDPQRQDQERYERRLARRNRLLKVAWRSKELENFLAHLSGLHLCGRYIGNGKYQRGAFPRARERSSRPESIYERDAAPKGYPLNWYDHTWLHAHPMRLASVQPIEPVPLCLPSAVKNQAKRFLSVKTRKDKPLPLDNV